jgi:long-chain acyl-CoA synthetase
MNLGQLFKQRAETEKDRAFAYFEGNKISFADLHRRVRSMAAGLRRYGLVPGDKVGIYLSNRPEYIESFLAAIYAGGVAMPLNPAWKSSEMESLISNSRPRFLIFAKSHAEEIEKIEQVPHGPEKLFVIGDESRLEWTNYQSLLVGDERDPFECSDEQVAVLTHTSGTTGAPKMVMLSHRNVMANFSATASFLKLRENDMILGVLPLYHVMGMAFAFAPLFCQTGVVLIPEFIPRETMTALQEYKITVFVSAPYAYTILGSAPQHPIAPISSMRFAISGGAPLRQEMLDRFEQRFHLELLEGYGMSEATCVITMNPPGGGRKVGSVGVPLPGVKVKVVGEDGKELKPGEIGELLVSGDSIMAGYLGDPKGTANAVRDGWLHTGDLGYRDHDGYFYIEGRKKDLIIRGGENIYPREVEEVLVRHPEIAEAAVIGLPDWVWGEEVMAFVVPRKDAALDAGELSDFCSKQIADYKCPRVWKIVSELPKSQTGEVMKKKLFELYTSGRV